MQVPRVHTKAASCARIALSVASPQKKPLSHQTVLLNTKRTALPAPLDSGSLRRAKTIVIIAQQDNSLWYAPLVLRMQVRQGHTRAAFVARIAVWESSLMSMEEQTVNFVLVEDMETKLQFSMNEIRISFHDASLVPRKYNQALVKQVLQRVLTVLLGCILIPQMMIILLIMVVQQLHLPRNQDVKRKAITGRILALILIMIVWLIVNSALMVDTEIPQG